MHAFVCDWLRERFNGVPVKLAGAGETARVS